MLSKILFALFVAYILHSMWSIFSLYSPPSCGPREECLYPSWNEKTRFQVIFATCTRAHYISISELVIVWKANNFNIFETRDIPLKLDNPAKRRYNSSLHLHAFFLEQEGSPKTLHQLIGNRETAHGSVPLTKFVKPEISAFNLLGSKEKMSQPIDPNRPLAHWKPRVPLHFVSEPMRIPMNNIPGDLVNYLRLARERHYLPIIYPNTLATRDKDLLPINPKEAKLSTVIAFTPITIGRLRLMSTVEQAMETLYKFGFNDKDIDDIKGIFFDTNIYLLLLTFFVSAFHLLFDFLSMKNDISFWKKRQSLVGVSFQTLMWRCASQAIIFAYLLDQGTSLLVMGPAGIAVLIEMWKLGKASKVKVAWEGRFRPRIWVESRTKEETTTDMYDSQGFKYLLYILIPLCIGGALYSLFFVPHKGWWSWTIQSLANGVYAFGFLFMLPQLFINYKLKSVAHLPWRAFMYKAFNTFIDDLFAFIIHMPTAHRMACFRDDIVFILYLIQRWYYPVDKSRVNEFGTSFAEPDQKDDSKPKRE